MKKIEQLERKDSAWNKAAMSEPVFVLRANDPVAAAAVRYWALNARLDHEDGKIDEAYKVAASMDQWRNDKADKIERDLARQTAAEKKTDGVEVSTSIHLQTPDGIVEVKSLADVPKDAPPKVHAMAAMMLGMMAATQAGATPEPPTTNQEDDEPCDVCKAAGASVCLGEYMSDDAFDILARGLGFKPVEETTH